MRHISRLKSFVWYGTVALLVTLAVLVTVARLTIGSVSEYRDRLELLAGKYLGQPVTISNMDARLVGFKPSILFDDVSLREDETHEQLAHFSRIGIALNPLSSLRHLSPIMDLTISGANIVIIQNTDGTFRLQGVSISQQAKNAESGGALGAWFLSQARLALEDSRIIWHSQKTGRDVVFEGVNVELQNLQTRHRLNASVTLPEELGRELRLALDIRGNLLNRRDWAGELYLKTEQVKPARWLKDFDYRGFRFNQGTIDLELWSRWEGGSLNDVEGQVDLSALRLSRNDINLPLNRLAGRVRYRRGSDGWSLGLRRGELDEGDGKVEPFALQLQQVNQRASIRARNLDIGRLLTFSEQIPGLTPAQRTQLQKMAPAGRVDALRVELEQGQLLAAAAALRGVSVKPWETLPGIDGLSGRLRFDGRHAAMELDSNDLEVELPRLFEKPLGLQQARGTVRASRVGEGWRVATEQLRVRNEDLSLELAMSLQLQPGETPLIALASRFHDGRIKAVPDYLPVRIMPEATVRWLSHAFVDGRVESGRVLLHGQLNKSLLRDEQGRFDVRFNARDVTLNYRDDWPLLEAVRGEVRITGVGMELEARSARIYQSRIAPTQVRIRDFRHAVLEVDGAVQATAADALRFLRESPLAAGAGLQQMHAEGESPIKLNMTIPLSPKVRDDSPLRIAGEVAFRNNRLQLTDGVLMQDVSGVLNFSESSFDAREISAGLFGHPASLTVFTEANERNRRGTIVVAARGHATAKALREGFSMSLLDELEGESDWQARLTLSPGESGSMVLDIHSSLEGMAVSLPEPLAKQRQEASGLSLSLGLGGGEAGLHSLWYEKGLKLRWQRERKTAELRRMALQLGNRGEPELPQQSLIRVTGELEQLDWRVWRGVLRKLSSDEGFTAPLPLQIRMKRLHLARRSDEGEGAAEAFPDLPPVDLAIESFAYGELALGSVAARIEPQRRSIRFNDISVAAQHFNLKASGRWRFGGKSTFTLKLDSGNLGRMLSELGFASVIRDGKTKASGEAEWPGSPFDFSLARLEAAGQIEIKEGAVEEVKPGAGKLLGLLSLEALPRRLFLDFSDLSQKGLRFTSVEGEIKINGGHAYTENLVMKALPADILVTGRTGLVARDFDQLVMVVPNVSDTVSVAGALAWGPQVAAALLVLQKIFKSDIDAATMTRYTVTGTWEKPVITRLEPLPLQDEPE